MTANTLPRILKDLSSLTPDDLRIVAATVETLLADDETSPAPRPVTEQDIEELVPGPGGNGSGPAARGYWIEVKTIKGRPYLYKRWREGGRCRSKYLHPVSPVKSSRR